MASRGTPRGRCPKVVSRSSHAAVVAKKVGNAVERNRVRRRLREMVRASAVAARRGHDYVVIGRRAALALPFPQLLAEFERALRHLHQRIARRQPQSSDTSTVNLRQNCKGE